MTNPIVKTYDVDGNQVRIECGWWGSERIYYNDKEVSHTCNWLGGRHNFSAQENNQTVDYSVKFGMGIFGKIPVSISRNCQPVILDHIEVSKEFANRPRKWIIELAEGVFATIIALAIAMWLWEHRPLTGWSLLAKAVQDPEHFMLKPLFFYGGAVAAVFILLHGLIKFRNLRRRR